MGINRSERCRAWCVAVLLLLVPEFLFAHELEVSISATAPAVIVRATYGGSEPVPFAKVQVYSPGASVEEFHTGRTDRRGYFSFVPDGGGNWRVVVDDEEGHRSEARVDVADGAISEAAPAGHSRVERALLGLALIIGFTGLFYGFKTRHRS